VEGLLGLITDRRLQGLFGIKAGTRWREVGLFGKVRPGLVNFQNKLYVVCVTAPCLPLTSSQTELALDLGAAIEFYPSRRLALRFDVGDLWIGGTGNDVLRTDDVRITLDLGHNLQVNAGVGIRF